MFFNHKKLKTPFKYLSRGFTLTEVLVIVLVIAVLMAIAYPLYTKAISKARAVEAINLLEIVRTKQVTQYVRTRGYYKDFDSMGQLTNNKAAEHANGTSITINDYTVKIDNQKECLTAEYNKGGVKFTMSASYSKEGLGCTGNICESFGSVVGSAEDVCAQCSAGETTSEGCSNGQVQGCTAAGKWDGNCKCPVGEVWSGKLNKCADCEPGTTSTKDCSNGQIKTCDSNGQYSGSCQCLAGQVWSGKLSKCADCDPGDTSTKDCSNGQIKTCQSGGSWGTTCACPPGQVLQNNVLQNGTLQNGICAAPCTPGTTTSTGCPAGKKQTCGSNGVWDLNCVDCTTDETTTQGCSNGKEKVCGSNSTWSGCQCTQATIDACDAKGGQLNTDTCACPCPNGEEEDENGVCIASCVCEDDEISEDECTISGQKKTCANCQWGSCECPTTAPNVWGGECHKCPQTEYEWPDGSCNKCPEGQVYAAGSCRCANDCIVGSSLNSIKMCDDNGEWLGASSYPYGNPWDYNPTPSLTASRNSARCITTASGGTWNGPSGSPSCKCICTPPLEYNQNTRICQCNNVSFTYSLNNYGNTRTEMIHSSICSSYGGEINNSNCSCVCDPTNKQWNYVKTGTTIECPAVIDNPNPGGGGTAGTGSATFGMLPRSYMESDGSFFLASSILLADLPGSGNNGGNGCTEVDVYSWRCQCQNGSTNPNCATCPCGYAYVNGACQETQANITARNNCTSFTGKSGNTGVWNSTACKCNCSVDSDVYDCGPANKTCFKWDNETGECAPAKYSTYNSYCNGSTTGNPWYCKRTEYGVQVGNECSAPSSVPNGIPNGGWCPNNS